MHKIFSNLKGFSTYFFYGQLTDIELHDRITYNSGDCYVCDYGSVRCERYFGNGSRFNYGVNFCGDGTGDSFGGLFNGDGSVFDEQSTFENFD
jgi:hypothetical protein